MSLLTNFLAGQSRTDGLYQISPPRAFMHGEEDYDRQYGHEGVDLQAAAAEAAPILEHCQFEGLRKGATVLEIGCGTGRMTLGLAMHDVIGHFLVTDPSPAFCGITKRKFDGVQVKVPKVEFGVLLAEDVGLLPEASVDMILLRSVLHHVLDVDGFLRMCAKTLAPGGLLLCSEPYYEGYLMMGFIGQFIEDALKNSGYPPSPAEVAMIGNLVATMQFYCRRDLDKTQAEDKHLFRPDELMSTSREFGLEMHHYPNTELRGSRTSDFGNNKGYFRQFFTNYIQYCMSWPPEFSQRVGKVMSKYFDFFDPIESPTLTVPYCFGNFVFIKK